MKTLTGVGPSARESEGVTALSKSKMSFCQAGSEDAAFGSYAPRCRLYYDWETVHNSIMADTCLLMLLSPCSVAWFSAVVAVVGFNPASVPEDTERKTEGKRLQVHTGQVCQQVVLSLGHAPEQPDAGVTCASGLVRVQHRYCRYLPCIPSSCHGGSVTQPASKRRVPGKQETLRHALDVPKDINHWTASTHPLAHALDQALLGPWNGTSGLPDRAIRLTYIVMPRLPAPRVSQLVCTRIATTSSAMAVAAQPVSLLQRGARLQPPRRWGVEKCLSMNFLWKRAGISAVRIVRLCGICNANGGVDNTSCAPLNVSSSPRDWTDGILPQLITVTLPNIRNQVVQTMEARSEPLAEKME